jgi:stage III sporulation protein AC
MDLSFILKIAGIGMIVAVVCQILSKLGKDDQSMLVSVGGIIFVLIIIIEELGGLINAVKDVFGI